MSCDRTPTPTAASPDPPYVNPNQLGTGIVPGSSLARVVAALQIAIPRFVMDAEKAWKKRTASIGRKDFSGKNEMEVQVELEDGPPLSPTASSPTKEKERVESEEEDMDRSIVKVRERAPAVFHHLRTLFGVSAESITKALTSGLWKETHSPGKGGNQFLFFDNYVLKTMYHGDMEFLKKFLVPYREHVMKDPATLLPRFLGAYTVTYTSPSRRQHTLRCLVMNHVFSTPHFVPVVFDIKGSSFGRSADQSEAVKRGESEKLVVKKDLDLGDQKIHLGAKRREAFLRTLASDCEFLQANSIVDYSVLLGIRTRIRPSLGSDSEELVPNPLPDGGIVSVPIPIPGSDNVREEIYYIGIIDILQQYTMKKMFENRLKGMIVENSTISVVPPDQFALRLQGVFKRIVV